MKKAVAPFEGLVTQQFYKLFPRAKWPGSTSLLLWLQLTKRTDRKIDQREAAPLGLARAGKTPSWRISPRASQLIFESMILPLAR